MKKRTRKPGAGRKSNASKGIENAVTRSFSMSQPQRWMQCMETLRWGQWLVRSPPALPAMRRAPESLYERPAPHPDPLSG